MIARDWLTKKVEELTELEVSPSLGDCYDITVPKYGDPTYASELIKLIHTLQKQSFNLLFMETSIHVHTPSIEGWEKEIVDG